MEKKVIKSVGGIVKCDEDFLWIVREESAFKAGAEWKDDMIGFMTNREYGEVVLIRQLAKHYRTFIDIGAHVGYYAIRVSDQYKKVLAFEPNPDIRAVLMGNIGINKKNNIRVFDCGLYSENKKDVIFSIGGYSHVGSLGNQRTGTEVDSMNHIQHEIKLKTLDYILIDTLIDNFVVKIDTEGAELEILKGAEKSIKKPSYWIIEHHAIVYDMPNRIEELKDFMESRGQRFLRETCIGSGEAKLIFTNHKDVTE